MIVLLHGGGDSLGYQFRFPFIARRCNRAGFNAATLVSPYHFQRRPRQPGALEQPGLLADGGSTAQAVAEIRALTGWLLAEGCPAVALWGIRMGGMAGGIDGVPRCAPGRCRYGRARRAHESLRSRNRSSGVVFGRRCRGGARRGRR